METRATPAKATAEKVSSAIVAAGITPEDLSRATGIQRNELEDHLAGRSPFTFLELLSVGGSLRLDPASLLAGVA